ncbi:MAG: PKD domain-containing protein [Bdellovibrionaceae bacterium]|nr:PKD domain-containing protein [Pseudobdellovibrionaceae bacterium]
MTGLGSDLHSISHTYTRNGLYKITLSLTNPENLTTRLETEINVYSGTPPLPLLLPHRLSAKLRSKLVLTVVTLGTVTIR